MFLLAQLWLLLDEREQLFPNVAFQYAVQELGVTNPKHVLVQPLGPSLGQASSVFQSSCSPVSRRDDPWLLCTLLLILKMKMPASD